MEASLVMRLAGPSTGKAGLATDQTEINRIIAEASKGSKFFDNEKRKDKELSEKIERLLKRRDELLCGVDVGRLEASIDQLLVDLEAERDLSQYIVHVDMDAFFAAVELLDNPTLKGKPFGVGKGVLSTASYEARLYGVRSGMAGFIATKLCPHIILVPQRHSRYAEMSRKVMDIFRTYDPHMLVAGADEAYLNITPYCQTHGVSPDDCMEKLRAEVFAKTNLTVSAGIAPNKMLAKICSDKNKPNGQFHLPFSRHAIVSFMHDLSIRKIPGIGRVTERLLDSIGIKTCGDIYLRRATLSLLDKQFHLRSLLLIHLGIGSNAVQPGQREERKSVGSERTFQPISDEAQIIAKLEKCAADLEADMERTGWAGRTITLKYKLDTYQVFTRAKSAPRYINRKEDLFAIGKSLLMPELPLRIRLIGLRVTKLKDLQSPEGQGLKKVSPALPHAHTNNQRQEWLNPQFFEPVQGSPNKKRQKLSHTVDEVLEDSADAFEEEQAMAEYEDESDSQLIVDDTNIDSGDEIDETSDVDAEAHSTKQLPQHPPRVKPRSTPVVPGPASSRSATEAPPDTKMSSSSTSSPRREAKSKRRASSAPVVEQQTCPICSKNFETDNAALNEHIDFCLSKGAILAATAVTNNRSPIDKERRRSGIRRYKVGVI